MGEGLLAPSPVSHFFFLFSSYLPKNFFLNKLSGRELPMGWKG